MGLEEFDNFEPRPPDKEIQLANGVGIAAGAAAFVMGVREIWAVDFVGISIAVGWGISCWGATRAATVLFLWFIDRNTKPTSATTPPEAPQQETTAVPPPVVNIDIETEGEPLEAWEQALEDKLKDNDRFLKLGERQWSIPSTVGIDHLFQLAEARANGQIRQFVSPNSLNDAAGISRNGKAPNAQSLIDFLASIGAVKSNGERRPYSVTELGSQLFPDKFETPPPAYVNGQTAIPTT